MFIRVSETIVLHVRKKTRCMGWTNMSAALQRHHDKYLHLMDDLRLPGCYGMTELGHGSNVMGIETTAEYDPSTQEFIINTPNDDASKYWIGGAAQHGKVCFCFWRRRVFVLQHRLARYRGTA
jgi:alkylation response protein AidB-like acyl-CoA dehydrogenase